MVFEKKNAARAGDMHTCPLAIRASGAGRVVTRADPRRRRAGAALSRGRALAAPLEKRESDAAAKERGYRLAVLELRCASTAEAET